MRSSMLFRSCGRSMRALRSSGRASVVPSRRVCSASARRKRSSAWRRLSVSRLSSSSVAPRSSRLPERVFRGPQRLLGIRHGAVLDQHRDLPQVIHDRAQIVVVARELGAGRGGADAEIDRRFRRETLGRDQQRLERAADAVALVGVEREQAALLDQRARQRLHERALGQQDFTGLAAALVAGLVAGDEHERRERSGPWMLGDVLGGLAGAGARARLRQREREIGSRHQRARRRRAFAGGRGRPREARLGLRHAVIVFELVGEHDRGAAEHFRVLGVRDGGRPVGHRAEAPGGDSGRQIRAR